MPKIMPDREPPSSIAEEKRAMRKRMRAMRLVAEQKEGPDTALAVAHNVLPRLDELALAPGSLVAGYWPISTELDVRPLLARLEARGIGLALPAIVPGHDVLVFRRWRATEDLDAGEFETRQPPATAEVVVPFALLVPLLAVDPAGHRLGHGRGWYDRTLAALRRDAGDAGRPTAIGVGFASQVVARVPVAADDQPVDWILTGRALQRADPVP